MIARSRARGRPGSGIVKRGPSKDRPRAFTLVELLVTIVIISLLAAISLGAINAAQRTARETKTKATIAKLNGIIMQRYESYMTRRVPIPTAGMTPVQAARARLDALRDLMRMEMPERWYDVYTSDTNFPIPWNKFAWGGLPQRPALSQLYLFQYAAKQPTAEFGSAECLYMMISLGSPEAMEEFNASEIGDKDGDGWPEFHDAWGEPIYFLRWAPGFADSELQPNIIPTGDMTAMSAAALSDHDPFDTRNVDVRAWRLLPLVYSGGPDKKPGLELIKDFHFAGDPYANPAIGSPDPANPNDYLDNIHNHRIQQQ